MQKQAYLQNRGESLQIPFPAEFSGQKTDEDDDELFISTTPRFLSLDEIALVTAYLAKLPYLQSLSFTGLVLLDADDPLLSMSHDQLDAAEKGAHHQNSRKPSGGGTRSVRERAYIIRERGYLGNGSKALAAGAA